MRLVSLPFFADRGRGHGLRVGQGGARLFSRIHEVAESSTGLQCCLVRRLLLWRGHPDMRLEISLQLYELRARERSVVERAGQFIEPRRRESLLVRFCRGFRAIAGELA